MNKELIIVSGVKPEPSITADAKATRDSLLAIARKGTLVNSPESAERAATVLKEIKAFTRLIESSRKEVKEPVLAIGKKIDAIAGELADALEAEASRIGKILGSYQAEQARIAEEARQKAWQEEQRIRMEAEAKEREAQRKAFEEGEMLRLKEERARSAEKAEEYAARAKLAAERAKQEEEGRQAEYERQLIANRATVVAAPKPAGVATRQEVCFEVTNIAALYEAAPYLVTLTANTSALKSALKGLQPGQTLPGVKHWMESKTIVR